MSAHGSGDDARGDGCGGRTQPQPHPYRSAFHRETRRAELVGTNVYFYWLNFFPLTQSASQSTVLLHPPPLPSIPCVIFFPVPDIVIDGERGVRDCDVNRRFPI